jgi:hypothetical protein
MTVIMIKTYKNKNMWCREEVCDDAGDILCVSNCRDDNTRNLIVCRGLAAHRASARTNKAPSTHDSDINA